MTLYEREDVIKKISKTLAIMMCDIKLNQSMNIFSLNIHSEDFYCNLFNALHSDKQFKNANAAGSNEAYIDLVDHSTKHLIQITTSTEKNKIDNSLKIIEKHSERYGKYQFEIYYLFEKPKGIKPKSIEEYQNKFGITDIRDHLKDFTDLLNTLKSLPDDKLTAIYNDFFREISDQYTDEICLQIVFESLVKGKKNTNYSVDFENITLETKMTLNGLNRRVASELHRGSEAALPICEIINNVVTTELRALIVDNFYKEEIKQSLLQQPGITNRDIANKNITELHAFTHNHNIDFSAILGNLSHRIMHETFKASFGEISMAWVIIAYFFEDCDIGVKK